MGESANESQQSAVVIVAIANDNFGHPNAKIITFGRFS